MTIEQTKMRGAIWDVALTQDEINALAAGISPILIRSDHLLEFVPDQMAETTVIKLRIRCDNFVAAARTSPTTKWSIEFERQPTETEEYTIKRAQSTAEWEAAITILYSGDYDHLTVRELRTKLQEGT